MCGRQIWECEWLRVTFVSDCDHTMQRKMFVFLFCVLTLEGERAGFAVFDNGCCEISKAEVAL